MRIAWITRCVTSAFCNNLAYLISFPFHRSSFHERTNDGGPLHQQSRSIPRRRRGSWPTSWRGTGWSLWSPSGTQTIVRSHSPLSLPHEQERPPSSTNRIWTKVQLSDVSRLNDCNKYDRFQAGRRRATATFLVPAPHTFSETALAAAGPPPRLDWWGISPSGRKGLSLKHSSGCKVKVNDDNECVYVITNVIYQTLTWADKISREDPICDSSGFLSVIRSKKRRKSWCNIQIPVLTAWVIWQFWAINLLFDICSQLHS